MKVEGIISFTTEQPYQNAVKGSGEGRRYYKFYDRTTIPECSEDRTAVPSIGK